MNSAAVVPLKKIVSELESGGRPKGGIVDGQGEIFSLGGEHLNSYGCFNLTNERRVLLEFFQKMKRGRVKPHDILIVKDGATTGKVSFIPENFPELPCAINEHVFRLSVKPNLADPKYVFYYLYGARGNKEIIMDFRGATIGGISKDFVYYVRIPLPQLPEQVRIAAVLDKADRLRRLRRYALEMGDTYLQSVFLEMFGDPRINQQGFPIAKFGNVCDSHLGKMLDAKQQTGKNKRPYLRNVNVQWNKIDISDLSEMDFDEKDRKKYRLKYGDVLICEGGEVGRAAIWRDELPECYFQKALHRASPNPKLATPEFIVWLMYSLATLGGLTDFTSQVTIAHLTGVKLKTIEFPLPPLALQGKFTQVVQRYERLRSQQRESLRQVEHLFQSLLKSAFEGGV